MPKLESVDPAVHIALVAASRPGGPVHSAVEASARSR